MRVTEVAYACGFESIPHFNRVFRQYAGISPTEYRSSQLAKQRLRVAQSAKKMAQ
jgi:AraC-like DNA-binding protein